MMLIFCIRYRRRSTASRAGRVEKTWHFEVGWTTATLGLFLILFVYGATMYIWLFNPPPADEEIYVVGKRWMWKIEHLGGQREIDELHAPVGRPIRLIMASQDVIHSFFVPAFRVKHDVVPGRYQSLWFEAQKTGVFQLLCAEFCGTDHSRMSGSIIVMESQDYESWLSRQDVTGTLAAEGAGRAASAM